VESQLENLVEKMTALGVDLDGLIDPSNPDLALLRNIFASVPLSGNRQREELVHCPETHRYAEVGCYPDHRVPVHGNVMEGITLLDRFYATQCPLASTVEDHLELIMKEKLMIVLIMGAASTRIPNYLPQREGEEIVYGSIAVKNIRASSGSPFKKLLLTKASGGSQEEKTHTFYLFQASGWPDSSTPADHNLIAALFRCALQIIKFKVNRGATNRICQLVHCSAGIGRTCTYIGIIQGIVRLLKTGVPFTYRFAVELLFHLRDQRFAAIQTFEQFAYMLRYIKDWCDWAPEHDPGSLEVISRF